MKKIILVIAVAISLSGDDYMCDIYTEKWKKSNNLAVMAIEDTRNRRAIEYLNDTLEFVATASVECGYSDETKKSMNSFRKSLRDKIKEVKNAL